MHPIRRRSHRAAALPLAIAVVEAATLAAALPARAGDAALDRLVAAYPDVLAGHDDAWVIFKSGKRLPVGDDEPAKSFQARLKSASIRDQLSLPYPKGPLAAPPGPEDDPGRFRNIAFFDAIYGDCTKGEVERHLVRVPWLPKSGGGVVRATSVNGVAEKLRAVSEELDALPPEIRRHAFPSAGTYNCRVVADTGVRSAHAWGIAIDLNKIGRAHV